MNVGRNFAKILRVIDALQTVDLQDVATPVEWLPGGAVIIPKADRTDEAHRHFPNGWTETRPYLRLTTL